MTAQIISIGTAVPDNKISQEQLYHFMNAGLNGSRAEKLKLKKIYRSSEIAYRHTILDDFAKNKGEYSFFSNEDHMEPAPSVSKRMDYFEKNALQLCNKAVMNCLDGVPAFNKKEITHIITFSCTGMYAPGLDIELLQLLELSLSVERTSINFMGCYAAFNAIKGAYHIVRSRPEAKVLLVGVELCSLHYHNSGESDQMIANAIFGDGAAAVLVENAKNKYEHSKAPRLEIKNFYSEFLPSAKKEMAWTIGDYGFNLKLGSDVPEMIGQELYALIRKLFINANVKKEDISYYAIHPGGVKILKACEDALGITKEKNNFSYGILNEYGNMSSVTVLFVLQKYMETLSSEDAGKNILSCAFGPGLTMESMILQLA
jgi:alpha-pyrone synthase